MIYFFSNLDILEWFFDHHKSHIFYKYLERWVLKETIPLFFEKFFLKNVFWEEFKDSFKKEISLY